MAEWDPCTGQDLSYLTHAFEDDTVIDRTYLASFYEDLVDAILATGPKGTEYLLAHLASLDPIRLAVVLPVLAAVAPSEPFVLLMLHQSLDSSTPALVLAALNGLINAREWSRRDIAERLRTHADPGVRGAVLRYIVGCDGPAALPALLLALSDPHPVIRETAVDAIDELDVVEALPHLEQLTADPDHNVRDAATAATAHLAERAEWVSGPLQDS